MRLIKLLPIITFPLMIKFIAGFYISDFFLVLLIILNIKTIFTLSLNNVHFFLLSLIIVLLIAGMFGLILDSGGEDHEFLLYVEYPIKLLLFLCYIFYFTVIFSREKLNINIYASLLFIPLILSLLAFYSLPFSSLLMKIYRLNTMFHSWRYGGIFGPDVNALGMYSSIVLIFLFAFNQKLNILVLCFGFFLSLICILLSGMRTGILVITITYMLTLFLRFLWGYRDQIIGGKILKIFLLGVLLFMPIIASSTLYTEINIEAITNRFSAESLVKDFDVDDQGNLAQALEYFNGFTKNNYTMVDFMIGKSTSLVYIDSLYLNLLIKYGFVIFIIILVLLNLTNLNIVILNKCKRERLFLFLFLFTLLVAIKGIFPMGNYYVFMMLSILCIYKNLYNKVDSLS